MSRNEKIVKMSLIAGVILFLTFLHYVTQRQEEYYHLFYRELYFFPLILAGIWFGLRVAILASLFITLSYLPVVLNEWNGFSVNDFDRIRSAVWTSMRRKQQGLWNIREKNITSAPPAAKKNSSKNRKNIWEKENDQINLFSFDG